jgi:hypothetical protein
MKNRQSLHTNTRDTKRNNAGTIKAFENITIAFKNRHLLELAVENPRNHP